MCTRRLPALLVLLCLLATQQPSPQLRADDKTDFFEKKIRPVLVAKCYECHSKQADEVGGKLLLDTREALRRGGESGPSVVSGKPDASLLIDALKYQDNDLAMPPDEPLPPQVVADFVRWVEQGAVDPRNEPQSKPAPPKTEDTNRLAGLGDSVWSFRPRPAVVPLPEVQKDWGSDPLDLFVLARLEAAALHPASPAPPRTLVRRLYVDLTGLQPTIEEIRQFEVDYARGGQAAVARIVDQLLSRREYGELWGRRWLDVARFGESNGDDGLGRNASFPHAWRYRDYVIDAFNRDEPYDRFLQQQIAGDLLPTSTSGERNRNLVATGFLAIGSKPAAAMNKNFAMDIVDDQIDVIGTAVLGLSVSCARCHDHKHDPITTRDYYALAGIFASTETLYGSAGNEKLTAPPTELHLLRQPNSPVVEMDLSKLTAADEYEESIQELKPVTLAPLNADTAELETPKSSFSAEDYAKVKDVRWSGKLPSTESYTTAFWFKNQLKNNARPITAYLFSRAKLGDAALPGDHLGIGGTHDKSRTGKLFVFNGNGKKQSIGGSQTLQPNAWHHVVLVRDKNRVRVYLNGWSECEIDGELPATFGDTHDFSMAARSDKFAPLNGNLAWFALFDRALTAAEAKQLYVGSGQPPRQRPTNPRYAMGVRDRKKLVDCKVHINGDSGKLGPGVSRGFLPACSEHMSGSETRLDTKQSGRLQLAQWLTRPDHPQTARVIVNRIWLHLFGKPIVSTVDDFGAYGGRPSHPELLDHLANRFVADKWSIKRLIRAIVLSQTYQLDSECYAELRHHDPENELLGRHDRRRLEVESLRDCMLQSADSLDTRLYEGSDLANRDFLINSPPGASAKIHQETNRRSVYLCRLRHAPPPDLSVFDLPDGVSVKGQRDHTVLPTHGLFLLNNPFVIKQADRIANRICKQESDDVARIKAAYRFVLRREASTAELARAKSYVARYSNGAANAALDSDVHPWQSLCQALLICNEFRYID